MPETLKYTTWQDWVERAETETRLQMFAPGDTQADHPKVTKAELAAIGIMEGYLRRRGILTPLDNPLPEETKQHLISLGMEFLTMSSDNRVDNIEKNFREAKSYFKDISLGHLTIPDLVPLTPEGAASATDILFNERTSDMDWDDQNSIGYIKRPPL